MIKRDIIEKIVSWLGTEKILILKGSRQVGKTTILQLLKNQLEQDGKTVIYLAADDMDNANLFHSPNNLINYLEQTSHFPKTFLYVMIDEFQYIKQAGLFLKNLFDKYKTNLQLIVSGSSSLEITKNTEFLTGRHIEFMISPVTFKEYFNFIEQTNITALPLSNFRAIEQLYRTFQTKLDTVFNEYITYGGYPEVVTTRTVADKKILLSSLAQTYIKKDIIHLQYIEHITGFNNLLRILANQIGQLVNLTELSNTSDLAINTVKKYLDIIQGTYVVDFLPPFYRNVRSEITKMQKVYLLDMGLKNYLLRSFDSLSIDTNGGVVENVVYLMLRQHYDTDRLRFYRTRTGTEIDFVVADGTTQLLCEVKYRNHVQLPTAIKYFQHKYPATQQTTILVTKNLLRQTDRVYYIPAALLPFINLSEPAL